MIEKLKKCKLWGCFNGTGVTSTNYKRKFSEEDLGGIVSKVKYERLNSMYVADCDHCKMRFASMDKPKFQYCSSKCCLRDGKTKCKKCSAPIIPFAEFGIYCSRRCQEKHQKVDEKACLI